MQARRLFSTLIVSSLFMGCASSVSRDRMPAQAGGVQIDPATLQIAIDVLRADIERDEAAMTEFQETMKTAKQAENRANVVLNIGGITAASGVLTQFGAKFNALFLSKTPKTTYRTGMKVSGIILVTGLVTTISGSQYLEVSKEDFENAKNKVEEAQANIADKRERLAALQLSFVR